MSSVWSYTLIKLDLDKIPVQYATGQLAQDGLLLGALLCVAVIDKVVDQVVDLHLVVPRFPAFSHSYRGHTLFAYPSVINWRQSTNGTPTI